MRKIIIILSVMIFLFLIGCENTAKSEELPPRSESGIDEPRIDRHDNIDHDNEENARFSYLEQLPFAKQEAYAKFASERDVAYLYNFTPEDIVLVYLNLISIADPDLIYLITYHADLLPDQDTFRKEYFKYASTYDSETAVHYRYYDSIEIDKKTIEDNKVTVVVTAGVGNMTHSLALGLQREDKLWKMDIYHLINYYKEKASE